MFVVVALVTLVTVLVNLPHLSVQFLFESLEDQLAHVRYLLDQNYLQGFTQN